MVAKTLHGLEDILAEELRALGAEDVVPGVRVVTFKGDKALMYKSNLYLRTAIAVLLPIHSFKARDEHQLYKGVQQIDWSTYLGLNETLAIHGVTSSDYFTHSQYAALKTKDAIVDQFRKNFGQRPSVDTFRPTLRINLHIRNDQCTLSLDSSGDPLFKRGYRNSRDEAPLNEVLAAGMIQLSGWDKKSNFIDPMCGSGTLPIEATMMALDIPPCIRRDEFGFERWADFDAEIWDEIYSVAKRKGDKLPFHIIGSDVSQQTLRKARNNMRSAPVGNNIKLAVKDMLDFSPPEGGGVVIMNPPYGERLEKEDINGFYESIGDQLKKNFSGYDAWIISSNMEALKHIGLRPSRKIQLFNGSLECSFRKYELYSGSKKGKYMDQNPSD
jgi:putative N6-adenine-specific DNA methylase